MFSSFIRFFKYFQVSSPSPRSAQSGPRQMKRWRRSLPMPKQAAASSGLLRFFPMAFDLREHLLDVHRLHRPERLPEIAGGAEALAVVEQREVFRVHAVFDFVPGER